MTYPDESDMDCQVRLVFVSEDDRRENPYTDFYEVKKTARDVHVGDSIEAVAEKYDKPGRIDSWETREAKYKGTRNISDFNTRMLEYYIRIVKAA